MTLDLVSCIFGMKVRQARLDANLTLAEFAAKCELSPSYATEIEKGRKYPRSDKIRRMAEVLGKDYDELVAIKLPPSLSSLESTISSDSLQRFPFREFGLEAVDLVNLLTREPDRASALLHSILELGRLYDLKEEDFLKGALRSYQEIHENYFADLEEAALAFTEEYGPRFGLSAAPPVTLFTLKRILRRVYHYELDDQVLVEHPDLSACRSAFIPGNKPRLLYNAKLYPRQIKFLLARELGYRYLDLRERSYTSTPERIDSFQQILNDFKAAYFGGALLMPRAHILADVENLFARPAWEARILLDMLKGYEITPEMLLYRFSELIPQFFGITLHFLRFQQTGDRIHLVKHLNMNQLPVPSGIGLHEHYCRRWQSIRLLGELDDRKSAREAFEQPAVTAQISEFLKSRDRFFSFGFARPMVLAPGVNSSVAVGFRVDAELQETIGFLKDPAIPAIVINETCERCPLTAEQCTVRAAEPVVLEAEQKKTARRLALDQLKQQFAG